MGKTKYAIRPANRLFVICVLTALLAFAGITIYFSYATSRESIAKQCRVAAEDIFGYYKEKVYDFSDVYIPVFADQQYETLLAAYYRRENGMLPTARQRAELVGLLKAMCARDKDIVFIALYNQKAQSNYYLLSGGNQLKPLPDDLAGGRLDDPGRFALLGPYVLTDEGTYATFLLKGGAGKTEGSGRILIGYDAGAFDRLLEKDQAKELAEFTLFTEETVIYDSAGNPDGAAVPAWSEERDGVVRDAQGKRWFTGILRNTGRNFAVVYRMPWLQMLRLSNRNTLFILSLLAAFALLVLLIYGLASRAIYRRVEELREGLDRIGDNRLDHRLRVSARADEFDEIAEHINRMAAHLGESVEKEYAHKVQQTRAELNQIQARFDPHFLYNTLEVIRGNLSRSGDMENADYLEKLSRIFRSLTDAEPATSIREEISFCSLYVSLLQLRYRDAVDVIYDIDPTLQDMGILAHLIQPAIENYFMHAMGEEEEYHELEISCHRTDGGDIRIEVADHGMGIAPERIAQINERIRRHDGTSKGYGLASIANRIRLFYGEAYGVGLLANSPSGLRVCLCIPALGVEEHRRRLGLL